MFGALGALNRLKGTDKDAQRWAVEETKAFARVKLEEQQAALRSGDPRAAATARKRIETIQRAVELLEGLKV